METQASVAWSSAVEMPPRMPEVGVLALVGDAWGGYWGSRHYMLTRLAGWFNVVWVDPPQHWREAWGRSRERVAPGGRPPDSRGFHHHRAPRWLPLVYRPPAFDRALACLRWRRARRVLERLGCRFVVLDLWRPRLASALDCLPHDLSCYHITDEYTYAERERPVDPLERELIGRVDQVFLLSRASFEKKGRFNPHSTFLPSGVDYAAFAAPQREPADLGRIPRPRMGYVGYVKRHLDFELLQALARRHVDWSFVVVGPEGHLGDRAPLLEQLRSLPNVYSIGGRRREVLPAYQQHLDVCLLCYRRNDYTKYVNPLKLREYLASGRPVVGAPLPAFEEFRDVVERAETLEDWSRALARALDPRASSPERVAARRRVARRYDWRILVDRMAETICERLGAPMRERFEALRAQAERDRFRARRREGASS